MRCNQYLMVTTSIWCTDRRYGVQNTAPDNAGSNILSDDGPRNHALGETQGNNGNHSLSFDTAAFQIVWTGPAFLAEGKWTLEKWTAWVSASISELAKFLLQRNTILSPLNAGSVLWQTLIIEALLNLTCDDPSDGLVRLSFLLTYFSSMKGSKVGIRIIGRKS